MIEIWWSLQITNILTHHRIITSSGWFKICKNFEFFSHFRGTKCRVEANNTREAVVVCSRHVVKQSTKRSALVNNNCCVNIIYEQINDIISIFLFQIYIIKTRLLFVCFSGLY